MQPCLRLDIEPVAVEVDGQHLIALRDPTGFTPETALVGPGALTILQYFDGTLTLEEIREDLARRGAGIVSLDDLHALVEALDKCLLLDNERYHGEHTRREEEFAAAPVRAATHAGSAYPDEAEGARAFLQEILDRVQPSSAAPLARLIAPHIDLSLGAEIHAHAHRQLQASGRPDAVVVLGVCHAASRGRFILCRKDFETPLGTVGCDTALADALQERLEEDLTTEQGLHRAEHSVEFQALWLAHLWPKDPPSMLPLLVGSFGDLVEDGKSPRGNPSIEAFVAALRGAIEADERRVVVVASVDLAHLGPQYGDAVGLDEQGERELESADRMLLEHVTAGDAEGFFEAVCRDGNKRNICGVAPVYVTLRLGEGPGELVRYGQGRIDPESGSVVSYAALSFAR